MSRNGREIEVLDFINAGMRVSEEDIKEGNIVTGWSPNNFRSLIIAPNMVLARTFTWQTGGGNLSRSKYLKTSGAVNVYKLLSAGRVLSNLEEVVVINIEGMPDYVSDFALTGDYSHRLSRLARVCEIKIPEQAIQMSVGILRSLETAFLGYKLGDMELYTDKFLKSFTSNYGLTMRFALHDSVDYSKYALRPSFYKNDETGGTLHNYFVRVAEEYNVMQSEKLAKARSGALAGIGGSGLFSDADAEITTKMVVTNLITMFNIQEKEIALNLVVIPSYIESKLGKKVVVKGIKGSLSGASFADVCNLVGRDAVSFKTADEKVMFLREFLKDIYLSMRVGLDKYIFIVKDDSMRNVVNAFYSKLNGMQYFDDTMEVWDSLNKEYKSIVSCLGTHRAWSGSRGTR